MDERAERWIAASLLVFLAVAATALLGSLAADCGGSADGVPFWVLTVGAGVAVGAAVMVGLRIRIAFRLLAAAGLGILAFGGSFFWAVLSWLGSCAN